MAGRRLNGGVVGPKNTGSGVWSEFEVNALSRAQRWPQNTYGRVSTQPADSATTLKAVNGGSIANGAYYYNLPSGSVQLYTDFTSFPSYPMVLVTKLSPSDQNQYLTTANNQGDLTTADTTLPSRSSKISDADLNSIIVTNTIRWVIAGSYATFFRMNDQWTSNFGIAATCSYTTTYFNSYATPSNNPVWRTDWNSNRGACGGLVAYDGGWTTLSGIHVADGTYFGGYTGSSAIRAAAPAAYTVAGYTANDSWGVPGMVWMSW